MTVVFAYQTHTGLVSKHNQDYVWVDGPKQIFIVADGMGGHEAGDVASRLTATMVGEAVAAGISDDPLPAEAMQTLLTTAIETANKAVLSASEEAAQKRRMGATLVMAVVQTPVAYIAHAGDARAYLIRGQAITRLTEDDSWVAHLVASGVIPPDEVKTNKLSHIITKAVGQDSPVNPTCAEVPVISGDWLLLCSDGLWNMVEDEQILAEVAHVEDSPQRLVDALTEAANSAGGRDNISVVALKIASPDVETE